MEQGLGKIQLVLAQSRALSILNDPVGFENYRVIDFLQKPIGQKPATDLTVDITQRFAAGRWHLSSTTIDWGKRFAIHQFPDELRL
jgi:hypothetical protein